MTQAQSLLLDIGEPLGEIVDVHGRGVHVHCTGEGGPTIWLENGWAGTTLGWLPFQEMLAQQTRVCAYDRAGSGWSEPSDIIRTAQNEADEFVQLLDVLGETEPFILLAWSGGGPVAQIVVADHPDKVIGLILMDAIPPQYDLWAMQTYPYSYWQEKQHHLEKIRAYAEQSALQKLRYEDIPEWFVQSLLDTHGDRYLKLILNNPNYWWTYYWENQFVLTSGSQVQTKVSHSNIPIKVIISSQLPADTSSYHQNLARMWQSMQEVQARLSTDGEVIWVDAGHAIFREQPQIVIDLILSMIDSTNNI
jgi:pimeloyl-ACP methyl ester carboxylesterase